MLHAVFGWHADPVLELPPSLVAHQGIDEYSRGQSLHPGGGRGEYVLLADGWHTCFFDLDQGLLGKQPAPVNFQGRVYRSVHNPYSVEHLRLRWSRPSASG